MAAYRELEITAQDGLRLYCRDYGEALATRTPVLCLSEIGRAHV